MVVLLRSSSGIWLACFISSDGHVFIGGYRESSFLLPVPVVLNIFCSCPAPHSITKRTPVPTTTSISPPSPTIFLFARVAKLLRLPVPLSQPLPAQLFPTLSNPSLSLPPGSSVVHRHSFPLFFFIIRPRSFSPSGQYIPLIFLLDMVIVFICVHLWCGITSVQCFGRRQRGRYDIASCSYDR